MNPALQGLITIIVGVGGCIGYFLYSNRYLDGVLFPKRHITDGEAARRRMVVPLASVILPLVVVLAIAAALWALGWVLARLSVGWLTTNLALPALSIGRAAFDADVAVNLLIIGALLAALTFIALPGRAVTPGENIRRAERIRPWLFLFPAMLALGLYLAYPVVETLRLSLSNRLPGGRSEFVGFENYAQMFGEPKFGEALRNNMLWLIVVPAASTAIGLLVAQLTDRIRWGTIAKSLIFMPMAISFVGAAVIFKLIYEARDADAPQIGILNAVWLQFEGGIGSFVFLRLLPILLFLSFAAILFYVTWILVRPILRGDGGGAAAVVGRLVGAAVMLGLGVLSVLQAFDVATFEFDYGQPQTWLTIPFWNNFFLMIVLIWIQTGFAMVILSAALRGIPEETVEAAIVDGANPFQVFFQIKIPQIMGTVVVVWTTITIVVLKVFDIVFAMTNGQWETQVLANYMYDKLFRANDWGIGSAAAMIIMLLVTPILVWNVYNARKEMR